MFFKREQNAYWTRQFYNHDAARGHRLLGREIVEGMQGWIDAFCAGVGTVGMLTGVSAELRAPGARTKVVALEPASAPLLRQGIKGSHRVEGISTGTVPPLLTAGSCASCR